ncbi:MAG: hypothetical protein ACKKMR_02670 [Candidatus Nealsonbacteria bacterium]
MGKVGDVIGLVIGGFFVFSFIFSILSIPSAFLGPGLYAIIWIVIDFIVSIPLTIVVLDSWLEKAGEGGRPKRKKWGLKIRSRIKGWDKKLQRTNTPEEIMEIIRDAPEAFKELKKKERVAMVTKLIAHYEISENLGKELDRKMEKIIRGIEKGTLNLEGIKKAEEDLKESEEKYEKAERNWLLEKNLVRTRLKLKSVQSEGTLPHKALIRILKLNRRWVKLWEEKGKLEKPGKIIEWKKHLKQAFTTYEIFLVIEKAPEEVKEKAWEKFLRQNPSNYELFLAIEKEKIPEGYKRKAWSKFLEQNPDGNDLNLVITFASEEYRKEALKVLNKRKYYI